MDWLAQNTDLVGVVLASIAITLSMYTALIMRRQQQLAAFTQCQEAMLRPDLRHGRRLLYRSSRGAELPNIDTDDHRSITTALSMFDVLGNYCRRRVVPRAWVLDHWHTNLKALRPGYILFAAERIRRTGELAPWPDLDCLFDRAANYQCVRPCCVAVAVRPEEDFSAEEARSERML